MKLPWRLLAKILLLVGLVALAEVLPSLEVANADWLLRVRPVLRFAAVLLALNIGLHVFSAVYRRRRGLAPGADDTILLGLRNVYYIVVAFVCVGGVIAIYGIDPRNLFTSLSIIAAAIAIVTRDFIVEIIAGLIMSFSGQIAVDDYISVGETKGRVRTMTLTKVVLHNEDDDLVHVPNTKVFGGELVNYTQRMQRRVVIEFEMPLAAIGSIDDLEAELAAALDGFVADVKPGSYSLRVDKLHKDYGEFKFRYTLLSHAPQVERDIRRKTSRAVINAVAGRDRTGRLG